MKSDTIRKAILRAPFELDNTGAPPRPGTLFVPPTHRRALLRDSVLVVGARGVGKSFWTAALGDNSLREQVSAVVPELKNTNVHIGYAARAKITEYPDPDTFSHLYRIKYKPYDVWRAIIARWASSFCDQSIPNNSWESTVSWVHDNPEKYSSLIEMCDSQLCSDEKFSMIVFDALDRTSNDWAIMDEIVRDLLRISLLLRDTKRIRTKVFLRPDQLARSTINFVDASKITATSAELTWEKDNLHAMLWQLFINAPDDAGETLRAIVIDKFGKEAISKHSNDAWSFSPNLSADPVRLRLLFEVLAGDKMGKDARRGVPYVWSVSHLADGHGWTSPRSFQAAILGAAEDTNERYSTHTLALHYESIKRGIQKASQIRVLQVAEDDPWVVPVMEPLEAMNVPCSLDDLFRAWEEAFPDGPSSIQSNWLPPQHNENWDGVRRDLERLGILVTRKDKRIDMPDLYRVGFKLGRKGGVAPRIR